MHKNENIIEITTKRFQEVMDVLNITAEDIANETGRDIEDVKWVVVNEKRDITYDVGIVIDICNCLNVAPNYFLGYCDKPEIQQIPSPEEMEKYIQVCMKDPALLQKEVENAPEEEKVNYLRNFRAFVLAQKYYSDN